MARNEDAIKMLLEAGTADKAIENVKYRLANKIKIPPSAIESTNHGPARHPFEGTVGEIGKRTGHVDLTNLEAN